MLKAIMSSNLKTLDVNATLKDAAELMVSSGIRRVPVTVAGSIIGVVSARTVIKEAISNQNWATEKLSDVAKPAITVDPDTPFRTAAKLMVKYGVGSLIIKGQGIVTERDLAKVIPRVTIPAISVGTTNVFTLPSDSTVMDAAKSMIALGISHIPITSGSDVTGVVSLRDVLKAIHEGNTTGKLSDIASKSLVYEDVDASVGDIANLIVSKYVGAVLLFEGEPKAANLRGIVTEWDLVRLYATMVRAHVLIKAEPSKIRGLVAALMATPRVYNVAIVYGPYDLLVTIDVEDPDLIGTTVINSIASLAGVKETTTLIEAEQI
ncbi:CBS domain-containing protein [Acidianus infernus]|uniref:CBS domain-containing protein n=1 Tax=Acidianus infernus TaxID=12915 RepID=UPI0035936BD5